MAELLTRRGMFAGLAALIAAPAIVRAASLMPIRALAPELPPGWQVLGIWDGSKIIRVQYVVTFVTPEPVPARLIGVEAAA